MRGHQAASVEKEPSSLEGTKNSKIPIIPKNNTNNTIIPKIPLLQQVYQYQITEGLTVERIEGENQYVQSS